MSKCKDCIYWGVVDGGSEDTPPVIYCELEGLCRPYSTHLTGESKACQDFEQFSKRMPRPSDKQDSEGSGSEGE